MAHFWSRIRGARGEASRCGTRDSGMESVVASWEGAVSVTLWHDAARGHDYAVVKLIPWHGKGVERVLYDGPVSGFPVHGNTGRIRP